MYYSQHFADEKNEVVNLSNLLLVKQQVHIGNLMHYTG